MKIRLFFVLGLIFMITTVNGADARDTEFALFALG